MDEDTRQHLEDLLQTHKRRLRVLEKQAAQYGTRTDPQIIMEVEDIQHELVRIRKELESESKFSSKEAQYNRSSSKFPQGVRYLWPIGILVAILLSVLTFSLSRNLATVGVNSAYPITPSSTAVSPILLSKPEATVPVTPTSQPSPTVFNPGFETSSILRISDRWEAACPARVIPEYIDPLSNKVLALEQIKKVMETDHDLQKWTPTPLIYEGIYKQFNLIADIQMTSIVSTNEQIQIGNTMNVSVTVLKSPEHVNVYAHACHGAGGNIRVFPSIELDSKNTRYNSQTKYTDFDYFFLKSGDFERFILPFQCHNPGIYYVTIGMPYRYIDESRTINLQSPTGLMCPQSFTVWLQSLGEDRFLDPKTYKWDGEKYTETP